MVSSCHIMFFVMVRDYDYCIPLSPFRIIYHHLTCLVGGIPTPLKNMKVSRDDCSQLIWKNKAHVPVTTNRFRSIHPNNQAVGWTSQYQAASAAAGAVILCAGSLHTILST